MPGESFENPCACDPLPGTTVPPGLAPFVRSVNDLDGIITIAALGGITVTSQDNTIYIAVDGTAGLGTVTSVQATSSNSNLTVTGGPVTVAGTFTFDLAGNLDSISGLVMAADQMLYSTAADTFAATSLTAFGRSLIDDAAAVNARSTLGLVIGTDVQAFSSDLSSFVTNATWAGNDLTLAGALTVTGDLAASNNFTVAGTANVTDSITAGTDITSTAGGFFGDGSNLTALNASSISTGTLAVARGGTGLASYTTGQVLYASAATTIAGLTAGAAGTFLRFAGAGVAPVVSTLVLPNAATVGDIFSSSSTNNMSRITAVATGNALISGGVATLPTWGKITTSHTTGIAASGSNADISAMSALGDVSSTVAFHQDISLDGAFTDGSSNPGNSGDILTSTNTGTQWSNQITLDTLTLNTNFSIEGTITAGGVTGAQTINKPSGTVNFVAAASSLVVTNSLCTTSHRVQCTVCTNDTTAKAAAAVVSSGAFTIYLNAAATAETAVYWELRQIS